jgi:hypothetical protein
MGVAKKIWQIIKPIRQADIFGANLNFKIYNKDSHKTLFGALMSTLVCSILLYKVVMSLKNIILKENLSFSIETLPVVEDEILLKNFTMVICSLFGVQLQKKVNYFTAEVDVGEIMNRRKILNANFTSDNCPVNSVSGGQSFPMRDYCICLDFNNLAEEQIPSIKSTDFMTTDVYMAVRIKINTTLFPKAQAVNLNQMFISFDRYYVNTSDYYSLIESNIGSIIQYNTPYVTNIVDMYYHNVQVDKVNDLLTFGLSEPDIESNFTYQYAYKELSLNQTVDTVTNMFINLRHSKNKILYTINSFSIDEFLSSFGGYFQIIFSFFSMVSGFYNEYSLERNIKKKLGRGGRSDKLIYLLNKNEQVDKEKIFIEKELKSNKTMKSMDNQNNELFSPISFERQEINLPKFLPQTSSRSSSYLINNQISQKSPGKHSRVSSKENFTQELDNISKAEKRIKNENVEKNYNYSINHENNEKRDSKIYIKKEQKLKSDVKKFSEISVDEFHEVFDFNFIYSIVKEIKLLKFFLLNPEFITLYNKMLKLNFSIENFEMFLCKQGNVCRDGLDSSEIKERIKALLKFLSRFKKE